MTQMALGRAADIQQPSVARLELGKYSMSYEVAQKLAPALNLEAMDLFTAMQEWANSRPDTNDSDQSGKEWPAVKERPAVKVPLFGRERSIAIENDRIKISADLHISELPAFIRLLQANCEALIEEKAVD